MRTIKTYALSVVALGGLFLIGSLMHSRDSQAKGAAYSTPVTVMNTPQTPVPGQDVDNPARHPYSGHCHADTVGLLNSCLVLPSPPANSAVVIQDVSMLLNTFTNNNATPISASVIAGGSLTYLPFAPQTATGSGYWLAARPTTIHADSNGVACNASVANVQIDSILDCTVSGYYVTLP